MLDCLDEVHPAAFTTNATANVRMASVQLTGVIGILHLLLEVLSSRRSLG